MVEASCHCGAVRMAIDAAPETVTDCNCSLCRNYSVLWAYYPLAHVRFVERGATDIYMWGKRSLEFHRCAACGCVTHWAAVDKARDMVAVNARLLRPDVLAAARVRHLDAAVTGRYLD